LGTTQIYVSRGIGTIVLPWRLRCPAEITRLELLPGTSESSRQAAADGCGLNFMLERPCLAGACPRRKLIPKSMRVVDLIRRKRDSGELTREEIEELIAAYTAAISRTTRCRVADGRRAARHEPPGNCRPDRSDASLGSVLDFSGLRAPRWTSIRPVAWVIRPHW